MAAAVTLLVGAGACGATTVAGWPLYQTLFVLGIAVTLAWLVDGSSRRMMGPGLAALAVGGGITVYRELGTEPMLGEHGIVYPLLGAGLLLASLFNPLAIRGIGTFLLIVGAVAQFDTGWDPGWTLTAILAVWGIFEFARIARTGDDEEQLHESGTVNGNRTRTPVGASA